MPQEAVWIDVFLCRGHSQRIHGQLLTLILGRTTLSILAAGTWPV